MKNRNFIEQHRNLSQEGYKKNQNIIYDNWVLYSYGKHYPLLFKVGDVYFSNNRWYSNSTAKHIWYANLYSDYWVKLIWNGTSKENVKYSLEAEKKVVTNNIAELKRKWTQKESRLLNRLQGINEAIEAIS